MIAPFAIWSIEMRSETFIGKLCLDGCFSRHELTKAAIANREAATTEPEDP
jgi:hypothetical protein